LSGVTLKNANLSNVSAEGADFSKATLVNTKFDGADFSGAKFDQAYVGKSDAAESVIGAATLIATNVRLDGATFKGTTLQRVQFEKSSATNTDFSNATANVAGFRFGNLKGANFDGVSGLQITFSESDLSGAALTSMSVEHKAFYSATLDEAKFSGTSLNHTGFVGDNLGTADLTGIVREAKGASFSDTNLGGIDFRNFDFSGAYFDGQGQKLADFAGANFTDVIFYGTDASQAKSFAGAHVQNTQYQSGNPGALANVQGVRVGPVRGQGIWVGDGPPPVPGVRWARTVAEARLMALHQNDAQAAISGTVGASDKDQAGPIALKNWTAVGAAQPVAPSAKDQAAALALKTLTAINDQLQLRAASPSKTDPSANADADNQSSLALRTLSDINDQIRTARDKADESGVLPFSSATLVGVSPGKPTTLAIA
jgi:uncharacterized protein YjbI with pentapeptide repeats